MKNRNVLYLLKGSKKSHFKKIKSQLREPSAHQAQLTHNHFIKPLTVLETILSRNTAGGMYLVFSGASVRIILIYFSCSKKAFIRKKAPPNTRGGMNLVYTTRVHGAGEQRAGRQPYLPDAALAQARICHAGTLDHSRLTIAGSPPCAAQKNRVTPALKKSTCVHVHGKRSPNRLLGRTRYQESGTHVGLPRLTEFKSILFSARAADALADSIQKSH